MGPEVCGVSALLETRHEALHTDTHSSDIQMYSAAVWEPENACDCYFGPSWQRRENITPWALGWSVAVENNPLVQSQEHLHLTPWASFFFGFDGLALDGHTTNDQQIFYAYIPIILFIHHI